MSQRRGEFADLIRQRRKSLGITLMELATATGLSVPYVSELERGIKTPPALVPWLAAMATTLLLNPGELAAVAARSRLEVVLPLDGAGLVQRRLAVRLAGLYGAENGITDEIAGRLLAALGEEGS